MPSSCSYSLGEVRVLKKCELISSNLTDRESSATILVTRSMLTSLNDSPVVSMKINTRQEDKKKEEESCRRYILNYHFFFAVFLLGSSGCI